MKHYPHTADAVLGAGMLFAAITCAIMVLATGGWVAIAQIGGYGRLDMVPLLFIPPFVVFIIAVVIVRHYLIRGPVPAWGYVFLLLATVVAMVVSFATALTKMDPPVLS